MSLIAGYWNMFQDAQPVHIVLGKEAKIKAIEVI